MAAARHTETGVKDFAGGRASGCGPRKAASLTPLLPISEDTEPVDAAAGAQQCSGSTHGTDGENDRDEEFDCTTTSHSYTTIDCGKTCRAGRRMRAWNTDERSNRNGGSGEASAVIPNVDGPSDVAEGVGELTGSGEHIPSGEHVAAGQHVATGDPGDGGRLGAPADHSGRKPNAGHEAGPAASSDTLPSIEEQQEIESIVADEGRRSDDDGSPDRGESPHRLRAFWHKTVRAWDDGAFATKKGFSTASATTKESFQHASDKISERWKNVHVFKKSDKPSKRPRASSVEQPRQSRSTDEGAEEQRGRQIYRSTSAQSIAGRSALSVLSQACENPHASGLVITETAPTRQVVGYTSQSYRTGGATMGMLSRRRNRVVPIYGPPTTTISIDASPNLSATGSDPFRGLDMSSSTHLPRDFRDSYSMYHSSRRSEHSRPTPDNRSTIWQAPVRSTSATKESVKDTNKRSNDNSGANSRVPSAHGGRDLPTKTERFLAQVADKALLIPSSEAVMPDSPVSPIRCGSIFGSDARDGYETPMTSPESSPDKSKPLACHFPRLEAVLPQLDGSHGSLAEELIDQECHLLDAATTQVRGENAVEATLRLVEDLGQATAEVESLPPGGQEDTVSLEQPEREDETLLGPASPANGARAFPFPGQPVVGTSSWSPARQRQPSALLQHCERNASSRQRRLMTAGLRTPDRFITSRPATPSKQALLMSRPAEKLNMHQKQARMRPTDVDPFAPAPRRSIRMAEQFATLRGPPTVPRPMGRTATLVDETRNSQRTASDGAIWHVGGTLVTEGIASTSNGRGGRVTSGTNAPHYTADFLRKTSVTEDEAKHGRRLALAMDIDQSAKVLAFSSPSSSTSTDSSASPPSADGRVWRDSGWQREAPGSPSKPSPKKAKEIPTIPFRVLDAPALRDDYYCSLLAYSTTVQCLAIGLGPHVYLWSETRSTAHTSIPESLTAPFASHVTSISFSSTEGGSAILAIGRADGRITLWSPLDRDPRFDSEQPAPVSCVLFRPNPAHRSSVRDLCTAVSTEELLVGDEAGNVYFYSVEWPDQHQRDLFDWHGSMTLLARVSCHSQQVCGLAWSPHGEYFATGGNDNQLFLFETKKILKPSTRARGDSNATVNVRSGSNISSNTIAGQGEVLIVTPGQHKQVFPMNAAVKAIAFAPWQPSLLAAGGGSNDRCIHFFHTLSGTSLATIDCHAQVTSLVWSEKRREIAGTFGFAQPEHPFRVAVFTWPGCRMVVGIPWWSKERALYAVAYPRGPSGGRDGRDGGRFDAEGRPWYGRRTREEGCLVVATSDASIKFHEIWAERGKDGKKAPPCGLLGGSQILEGECSWEVEHAAVIR
ncbi:hypothetical protein LTR85_009332 [Meristemomyces frigidus]|nr:hypothetical protein LTR85_009332 [Meristemomyces frigidus]